MSKKSSQGPFSRAASNSGPAQPPIQLRGKFIRSAGATAASRERHVAPRSASNRSHSSPARR